MAKSIKVTASGTIDKRTKEGKVLSALLSETRTTKKKRKSTSTKKVVKKTAAGKIDKRTKEGKAVAERMAKARKAKGSLVNRIKRLFR